MPATATGRGAQVIIDPASDTAKAIRGAYAPTLEANGAKVAADIAAGLVSSGYRPDGTTSTGGVAADPDINPSSATDTFAGGISFGSVSASNSQDLSKHIALYSTTFGFCYSGGGLAYNTDAAGSHQFFVGGGFHAYISATGTHVVTGIGFWNTAPLGAKPTVTGSKGANAALTSLLTALAAYGLITDSST